MHATLDRSQIMSAAAPSVSGVIAYVVTVSADSGVQVRVAGTTLPGSYAPTTGFAAYSASFLVAAAGNTEIAFVGLNPGDNTALIDNVVLSPVTSSLTPPSGCMITAPTSLVSRQSGSFSVTCSAGSAPLSYAWSRTLTGFSSTAQSFTDTPFSSATTTVASATYSVNVSNAAGNQVAAPINVANGSFTGPPPSTGSETLTFIHPNVSGSPIMATDANGAVLWREDYSAFGERTKNQSNANAGTAANQQWFIGKPQDTQTGLVYFGARWYDPVVGRFLGFDPAGVDEDNPHSFNRYSYGNNNPNKYLDPDGRMAFLIPLIAAAIEAAPAIAAVGAVGYAAGRAAPGVQRAVATAYQVSAHPATQTAIQLFSEVGVVGRAAPISLLNGPANTHVYVGLVAGLPNYAGITTNLVARESQHAGRFAIKALTSDPVTNRQARAIEQVLIESNPNFQNKINSISPNRTWYDDAKKWGAEWLNSNGVKTND